MSTDCTVLTIKHNATIQTYWNAHTLYWSENGRRIGRKTRWMKPGINPYWNALLQKLEIYQCVKESVVIPPTNLSK